MEESSIQPGQGSGPPREGIQWGYAVPYATDQNGVAERIMRTIVSKTRISIIDSQLDESLWAEVMDTIVYLTNRSPTESVADGRYVASACRSCFASPCQGLPQRSRQNRLATLRHRKRREKSLMESTRTPAGKKAKW